MIKLCTLSTRSEKVKNCLGQLVSDLVDQCPCSRRRRRHLSKRIRCAGDSVRTFVSRLGKNEVCRSGAEEGKEEEEGAFRARARHRSMSCPSLPCREEKRNTQADGEPGAVVGSDQPAEEEVTNMIGANMYIKREINEGRPPHVASFNTILWIL